MFCEQYEVQQDEKLSKKQSSEYAVKPETGSIVEQTKSKASFKEKKDEEFEVVEQKSIQANLKFSLDSLCKIPILPKQRKTKTAELPNVRKTKER